MKNNIRNDFPALNTSTCYLDNAATTHKPQAVIDAVSHVYTHDYAPIHRGLYTSAEAITEQYEAVRTLLATWLGNNKPHEIVLTYGATDGMHTFISSWARSHINTGDEIVYTELDHHMVVASCRALATERNASIRVIPILNSSCALDTRNTTLQSIITNRTRLLVIPLSSNIRGPLADEEIDALITRARAVGAIVVGDASQVPAHQSLEHLFTRWKPDVLIWSSHKSFGPSGVGALYITERLHQQLVPYHYGGGMIHTMSPQSMSWRGMPRMLEAGTRSIEAVIGFGAAISYLQKHINYTAIQNHEAALVTIVLDGIADIPGITILGNPKILKAHGHMVTFSINNIHPHDIALCLADKGIAVRAGDHCCQPLHKKLGLEGSVRISFALYNTPEEAHQVVSAIHEAIECLR